MMTFLSMFNSPRLLWVYGQGGGGGRGGPRSPQSHALGDATTGATGILNCGEAYIPNFAESWGQYFVSWVRFLTELSLYTSPFLIYFFSKYNPKNFAGLAYGTTAIYVLGLVLRSYGRFTNPVYVEFAETVKRANANFDTEAKEALAKYDCEFWAWPVEFKMSGLDGPQRPVQFPVGKNGSLATLPHRVVGWFMINTFGLKMIYPGSTKWLLQALLGPTMAEHRAQLVVRNGGRRAKLHTADGNSIDSMFFDRRGRQQQHVHGDVLVICCEGNAGFYEMGMLTVPLDAGYSVIGWNHPGFYGSSGSPFPDQDAHAIHSVMQYALTELRFPVDKIVVYGWSIGGFPAAWLAKNYPEVKGVILDATFDHLVPLAVPRMPACLESIVKVSIETFVNLDVGAQLVDYPGPVRLIRRSKDEMISTDDKNSMQSNRGNDLLVMLLRHRYPKLFDDAQGEVLDNLTAFLAVDKLARDGVLKLHNVSEEDSLASLTSHSKNLEASFP